jgi:hypothetical protein
VEPVPPPQPVIARASPAAPVVRNSRRVGIAVAEPAESTTWKAERTSSSLILRGASYFGLAD